MSVAALTYSYLSLQRSFATELAVLGGLRDSPNDFFGVMRLVRSCSDVPWRRVFLPADLVLDTACSPHDVRACVAKCHLEQNGIPANQRYGDIIVPPHRSAPL